MFGHEGVRLVTFGTIDPWRTSKSLEKRENLARVSIKPDRWTVSSENSL